MNRPMRIFSASVIGGLICSAAIAQQANEDDPFVEIAPEDRAVYKRSFLDFAGGYREKKIGDDRWKISNEIAGGKFYWLTDKVAVRRASELAIASNKPFAQVVVKKAVRITNARYNAKSALLVIEATAVDQQDATAHCDEKISVFTCKTFSAEVAMTETLPYLKIPVEK